MDKYEVATLAEDYHNKRLRFQMLGARNSYGRTPEEQMEASVEYHVAEAEMMQAYKALAAAKIA